MEGLGSGAETGAKAAASVPRRTVGDVRAHLKEARVRLNKKGALESLLAKSICEVAKIEKPGMRAQSVTKFAAGKNRLLLRGDLAVYILQNVLRLNISGTCRAALPP